MTPGAQRLDPEITSEWAGAIESVYVHVPFCAADCSYCAFAREVPASRAAVDTYLDALRREAGFWRERLGARVRPRTLYFGGGTPTFLTPSEWDRVEGALQDVVDFDRLVELTVEANPESTTRDRLARLRELGMTRFSLGAQAIAPPTLELLGRTHGWSHVVEAVACARDVADLLVSLDLIYGVPGLTQGAWEHTLDAVLELAPDHLSAYCLTYEEGTALARRRAEGGITDQSDDTARDAYDRLVERAESRGLARYEVSNFGTSRARSQHNLCYWEGGAYLGLGPSAHSHVGGTRFRNHAHRERWEGALATGRGPVVDIERPSVRERRVEHLMRLRVARGVPVELLPASGGAFWSRANELERDGLIVVIGCGASSPDERDGRGHRLALSHDAFFVADAVVLELLLAWDEESGAGGE